MTPDQVEALFSTVDETGHANAEAAAEERRRRARTGFGRAVDPLSGRDPSGSNVGAVMGWAGFLVVLLIVAGVIVVQVISGAVRHDATAALADEANLQTVTRALQTGVEWGGGFTQFPDDFTVQVADEESGRIEVSVIDTTYASEMEAMASSQIQAAALSVNALMNPDLHEVVYEVFVHVDDEGRILSSSFFSFLQPAGQVKPFMTFTWQKGITAEGELDFNCSITGIDAETEARLRERFKASDLPFLDALPLVAQD